LPASKRQPIYCTRISGAFNGPALLCLAFAVFMPTRGDIVISRTPANKQLASKLCRTAFRAWFISSKPCRRIRKSRYSLAVKPARVQFRLTATRAQCFQRIPPRAQPLDISFHLAAVQFWCPRTGPAIRQQSGCADDMASPFPLRGWRANRRNLDREVQIAGQTGDHLQLLIFLFAKERLVAWVLVVGTSLGHDGRNPRQSALPDCAPHKPLVMPSRIRSSPKAIGYICAPFRHVTTTFAFQRDQLARVLFLRCGDSFVVIGVMNCLGVR